jgi:hypothetical protein
MLALVCCLVTFGRRRFVPPGGATLSHENAQECTRFVHRSGLAFFDQMCERFRHDDFVRPVAKTQSPDLFVPHPIRC